MLAGCDSLGLGSLTGEPPASNPEAAAAAAASGGRGIYKIGKPYQIAGTWYYPAEDWSYDETGIASWYGEDFHGKFTANGEVYDLNAMTAAHRTLPMPCIVQVTNLDNGRSIKLRVNDRGPYARNRIIDVSRRAAQLLGFEGNGTAKVRVQIVVADTIQVASLAGRNGGELAPPPASAAAPRVQVVSEQLAPPPGARAAPPPSPTAGPTVIAHAAPSPTPSSPPVPPPPLPERVTQTPVKSTQIYVQAGAYTQSDNAQKMQARMQGFGPVRIYGAAVNGVSMFRVRIGPIGSVDEADRLLDRVVGSGAPEARIVVD